MASFSEYPSSGFELYDNPRYGITIQIPDDWTAYPVQDPYWFVEFYPSSTPDNDLFPEYVIIGAERVYPNTPINEYADYYVEMLQTDDANFRLLESTDIQVDSNLAHRIVYTTISSSEPLVQGAAYNPVQFQSDIKAKIMEVSVTENEIAYTITYAAEESKYNDYLSTVERMIQSAIIDTSKAVTDNAVSGLYKHTETGLSVEFPDGWNGYESTNKDRIRPVYPYNTMVVLRPIGSEANGPNLSILIANTGTLREEASKVEEYTPCVFSGTSIVRFNEVKLFESISECTYFDVPTNEISYAAITPDSTIFLAYSGYNKNAFNNGIDVFKSVAGTLEVPNSLDWSDLELISTYSGENYQKYEVTIDQQPYDIAVSTTSQITDFEFSEDKAEITFTLNESEQWGITEIELGHVLTGPYIVMIGGQESNTTSLLKDSTTNNPTSITFEHLKGTHHVSVIGTSVVPEFPLVFPITLLAIACMILITRNSRGFMT